jgi:hypothetical protein
VNWLQLVVGLVLMVAAGKIFDTVADHRVGQLIRGAVHTLYWRPASAAHLPPAPVVPMGRTYGAAFGVGLTMLACGLILVLVAVFG